MLTRAKFIAALAAQAALLRSDGARMPARAPDFDVRQREIDNITPSEYRRFLGLGVKASDVEVSDFHRRYAAFARYDRAFRKAFSEALVMDGGEGIAVWLIYNMGILVKTPKMLFTVDLHHRLASWAASKLDFALITHNHLDHYTEAFYNAMNDVERKVVVNNFADNGSGGYTQGDREFAFGDVRIRTGRSDHNRHLVDFVLTFEITIGDFTIYHTGDSCNVAKLNPVRRPDIWIVHPRVGLRLGDGVEKFHPRKTVITHLNELQHAKGHWRWSWQDGLKEAEKISAAGADAIVPLWGDRIV